MILRWHGLVLVFAMGGAAAVTSLVACGSSSGGSGGDGGAPDASTEAGADAAGDSGASDANTNDGGGSDGGDSGSSSDAGDANVTGACTGPTAGADGGPVAIGSGEECEFPSSGQAGSVYAVTSSMTIAASPCGVYDAPHGITVTGTGTVLTIEPGVTIAFGANQVLQVTGGAGIVVGKRQGAGPCAPVVFTSDSASPTPGAWGQVLLQSPIASGSSISNLIVQYAGTPSAQLPVGGAGGGASLAVDGSGGDFSLPLDDVTLSNNGALPVYFYGNHTGPASGSGTLTVTDWPVGADPFTIFADAAGLLSNIHLSTAGAAGGTVHLKTPGNAAATIDTTLTWPSISPLLSYVLAEPASPFTAPDVGQMDVNAALTIAAPNTLLVGSNWSVVIDAAETGAGSLTAIGNVTFKSLPGASPWGGMEFHYPGWKTSTLSGVTFENVGPGQDEGCYVAPLTGPPTGALLLFYSGAVCEDAPPWSGLTFPGLTADYAILPWSVNKGGVTALAASNPGVSVYTCAASGACDLQ